ncbi:hypothetical protein K2173_001778 [Erythroxylum novogranatense]|uniref:Pentatricopeptide repeat-containing protein n=1 Tax=Erythroxylum novogranatense TaxID=1862640 RepID=A0AAV8SJG7_9ROSI|nr:hypothetical protein K2173_001778 [Erythroxylum novogranatense]
MDLQHRLLQLLKARLKIHSLCVVKHLHALAITLGPSSYQPTFLHNNIITLYASLDELPLAHKTFVYMPQRNLVSYNTMISSYSKHNCFGQAWSCFYEMMSCGFRPNQFTFAGLLSCASVTICAGVLLQALTVKNGLFPYDVFVGTALMGLFGKCGRFDEALHAFDLMPNKSLVTWNSMISLFGCHGFVEDSVLLFRELAREERSLSEATFVGVLSGLACERDLELGEQVHSFVIKNGCDYELSVVNSIVNMYANCANIDLAEKTFEGIFHRDLVTWNTIIGAQAKSKKPGKALELFLKMSEDEIRPNQTTFVSIINSLTSLVIPMCGEWIHAKVILSAFQTDVFVGSALVDYYAKWNKLDDAYSCFLDINEKNVVSWNTLILGYANNCSSFCISLLREMLRFGYRPSEISFSAALKSSHTSELQQLHCQVVRLGYDNNAYVLSTLITSYGRNDCLTEALAYITASETPLATVPSNNVAGIYNRSGEYLETLKLLSQLENPDVVSWNIALAACAHNCNYEEVLRMFKHMLMDRIPADSYTYVSVLSICTKLCNITLGSSIHSLLIKTCFSYWDVFVCNMLINMYGKCGSHGSSIKIFSSMKDRNLITWTTLVSALAVNGCAQEALIIFNKMAFSGFRPDKVAFLAALTACQHRGLVREGLELLERMDSYGIKPEIDHYQRVVDLLARSGHLREAEKIIATMPFPPNAIVWRSFLEGCHRNRTA